MTGTSEHDHDHGPGYDDGFMDGAAAGYEKGRQAALAIRTAADQIAHGYPDEATLQAALEGIAGARTAGKLGELHKVIPWALSLPAGSQARLGADLGNAAATGDIHALAAAMKHWHEIAG